MKLFTIGIGSFVKIYTSIDNQETQVKQSPYVQHSTFEREELIFDQAILQCLKLQHKNYEEIFGKVGKVDFTEFVCNHLKLSKEFVRTCIVEKLAVFSRKGKINNTRYLLTVSNHKVTMI